MRDSFRDMEESGSKELACGQQNDTETEGINEISSVAYEMVRLIETGTAPVFGVDTAGIINGWNAKVAELTGLQADHAIGKSLADEVVHEDSQEVYKNLIGRALQAMEKLTGYSRNEVIGKILAGEIFGGLCQLKGQDSMTRFMIMLYQGISGRDAEKFPFSFFDRKGKFVEVYIVANRRTAADGNIIGCFCFLQVIVPAMQEATEEHKQEDKELFTKLKHLVYMRQEMKNPLNGIRFTHKLLETTAISENQKQFLETSDACERQITAIIEDIDFRSDDEGMELSMEEFVLGNVLDAVVSQVMILLKERNLQLFHETPKEIKALSLYGDRIRLQLVLSDFLLNMVHHAPSPDGWVEIKISPGLKLLRDGNEFLRLQFRMTHPGKGLPSTLIQEMLESGNSWTTQEGLGLNMSRKLLNRMNGHVQYVREHNKCYFLIDLEIKTKGRQKASLLEQH
ncbi:hypothetical protein V6Z12_A10G042100 [Gossypium hirsutum]